MLRVALRSLLARKLRLGLSAIAVVIGVSMVSGTYVLTDTLGKVFDDLFRNVSQNTAVVVRAPSIIDDGTGSRPPIDESYVAQVRAVPGVSVAEPSVQGDGVSVVDPQDGEPISNRGAPGIGLNWQSPDLSALTLRQGRAPVGADEVAIDRGTFREAGLSIGQEVTVTLPSGPDRFRVVGVVSLGDSDNFAGATITVFETPVAQEILLEPGKISQVEAAAEPGVDDDVLSDRVRAALGDGVEVLTGEQLADETAGDIQDGLAFFNTFLLVFGFIALFVGAFIISNTFSMLVGQRVRELALLRAVGASRRQITVTVLLEAVAVGLLGSTVGLALGVGVAMLLRAALSAFGVDLPSGGLVFVPRTVVVAYLVGVLVTSLSALLPALRAGRVPPVAALRETYALPARSLRSRAIVGAILLAGGVLLMVAGLGGSGSRAAATVAIGAGLVFVGVATLSPVVARPVVRLLGAPVRSAYGAVGHLSSANAERNPRRTAATASALMVGLALVSGAFVFASSVKESVGTIVRQGAVFDFILTADNFALLPPKVADDLAAQPGVLLAAGVTGAPVQIADAAIGVVAIEPDALRRVLRLVPAEGDISGLANDTVLISEAAAVEHGWDVGDTLPLRFAEGGQASVTVAGIYRENALAGDVLLSRETLAANSTNLQDFVTLVRAADGASLEQVRERVTVVAEAYPGAKVETREEYIQSQDEQINQVLGFVTVLLLLSVFVAAFGIVNTLALSVIERTREIGLLRAVGMSRRQLRRMVRLESVVISVYGALLGLVIGSVFGWAVLKPLRSEGLTEFAYPTGYMVLCVAVAALLGVLAAIFPARRAARLDVLQAIATT